MHCRLKRVTRRRSTMSQFVDVPRGLKNVVVTETGLGDVRGSEGFYHYRQYSAVELARERTVEDVWYLLYEGRLPDPRERAAFAAEIADLRHLPDQLRAVLPALAEAEQAGS